MPDSDDYVGYDVRTRTALHDTFVYIRKNSALFPVVQVFCVNNTKKEPWSNHIQELVADKTVITKIH
jgi:hypothetical protein